MEQGVANCANLMAFGVTIRLCEGDDVVKQEGSSMQEEERGAFGWNGFAWPRKETHLTSGDALGWKGSLLQELLGPWREAHIWMVAR